MHTRSENGNKNGNATKTTPNVVKIGSKLGWMAIGCETKLNWIFGWILRPKFGVYCSLLRSIATIHSTQR